MKTRLALLCLWALLVLLGGCEGRFVSNTPPPSAAPGVHTPRAEPQPTSPPPQAPGEASQPPAISQADYHAMVSALSGRIWAESEILIRAGLYEYNWWASYSGDPGEVDLDAMVELVMAWLSETYGTDGAVIAAVCDELTADYAAVARASVEGGGDPRISDLTDSLVGAYYQLYTIVTQPSGTVQDFVRMLCSCTYSISAVHADLTSALDAFRPEGAQPLRLFPSRQGVLAKTALPKSAGFRKPAQIRAGSFFTLWCSCRNSPG